MAYTSSPEPWRYCDVCRTEDTQPFSAKRVYEAHLKSRTHLKKIRQPPPAYSCPDCNKSFSRADGVKRHQTMPGQCSGRQAPIELPLQSSRKYPLYPELDGLPQKHRKTDDQDALDCIKGSAPNPTSSSIKQQLGEMETVTKITGSEPVLPSSGYRQEHDVPHHYERITGFYKPESRRQPLFLAGPMNSFMPLDYADLEFEWYHDDSKGFLGTTKDTRTAKSSHQIDCSGNILQQTRPTTEKAHRGSVSRATQVSPKNLRTSSSTAVTTKNDTPSELLRKLSNGSDARSECTRFHEYTTSDDELEEWFQKFTCWPYRLTVSDTPKREYFIRNPDEDVKSVGVANSSSNVMQLLSDAMSSTSIHNAHDAQSQAAVSESKTLSSMSSIYGSKSLYQVTKRRSSQCTKSSLPEMGEFDTTIDSRLNEAVQRPLQNQCDLPELPALQLFDNEEEMLKSAEVRSLLQIIDLVSHVRNGIEINLRLHSNGQTPLMVVFRRSSFALREVLIKYLDARQWPLLSMLDNNGDSIIDLTASDGTALVFTRLIERVVAAMCCHCSDHARRASVCEWIAHTAPSERCGLELKGGPVRYPFRAGCWWGGMLLQHDWLTVETFRQIDTRVRDRIWQIDSSHRARMANELRSEYVQVSKR